MFSSMAEDYRRLGLDTRRPSRSPESSASNSPSSDISSVMGSDALPHTARRDSGIGLNDDDPACIVGIGCRLPGGIRSPSQLWDLLVAKRSTQGRVPAERFNIDGYSEPGAKRAGVFNADGGYFLDEDVRQFDNTVFGLNNLEAAYMDPQQRKLLEVTYECLEDAGTSMTAVAGSETAVYVGNFTVDHPTMQARDPDYYHRYSTTGGGMAILANRISHIFDLRGPSVSLDTACSSSVYSLHCAVAALRNGDCTAAIVAGANLITSVEQHLSTMVGGVLSATSTCHTFDSSADGYGRAEAVNAILIKPLSRALRDGDRIRAVIRGTAINSNGRTNGITQPSAELQATVIRKAYRNAGLSTADTAYVECHGTGTAVGDPIEVEGIGRVFDRGAAPRLPPLMIGGVKTNLGHSEAASGLSAIIKVVLAFERGGIPPSHGIVNLNPKLRLDEFNLRVVADKKLPWPPGMPKRASINSFGYGGANGHVILEAPESYMKHYSGGAGQGLNDSMTTTSAVEPDTPLTPYDNDNAATGSGDAFTEGAASGLFVLPVSAHSKWSLERRIDQMTQYVRTLDASKLPALAKTLGKHRAHLEHRACLVADGRIGLPRESQVVNPGDGEGGGSDHPPRVGFVFTGQGAQYAGMGRELLQRNHVFRRTIRRLDDVLRREAGLPLPEDGGWTIEQTLLDPPEKSAIDDPARSQPCCTALQVALVDVLASWGVHPTQVVGHSSGEIAAAYAAGHLTADQAILVAYHRGAAVAGQPQRQAGSGGAMLAAGLGAADAQALIDESGLQGRACVACVNAPASVTLSGESEAIEELARTLESSKTFFRRLRTGGQAYHSHLMKKVGPLYEDAMASVFAAADAASGQSAGWPGEPVYSDGTQRQATMYSSVGASPNDIAVLESGNGSSAAYWRANLESPVQFRAALSKLVAGSSGSSNNSGEKLHLIEIGPHAALKGPIEQTGRTDGHKLRLSPSLLRGEDAESALFRLTGELFLAGHSLDWAAVNNGRTYPTSVSPALLHDLPPYPWDYSAGLLWSEPRASVETRNRRFPRHELLGVQQVAGNGIDHCWRNRLSLAEVPWLRDHKVETQVVFPAVGYLGMVMEALRQVRGAAASSPSGVEFRAVNIGAALVLLESEADGSNSEAEIHTTLAARKLSTANSSSKWFDFSISSWDAGATVLHCAGSVRMLDAGGNKQGLEDDRGTTPTTLLKGLDGYGTWTSMSRWYARLAEEGFRFGPAFQSITSMRTDGRRTRADAVTTTALIQRADNAGSASYPVHPITIDACLQAGILGATAGDVGTLRAMLPVFINSCRVYYPDRLASGTGTIHSRARTTGFATKQMDATLRDTDGSALVDLQAVRFSLYSGIGTDADAGEGADSGSGGVGMSREPCLSVVWKPDVLRLRDDDHSRSLLHSYLEQQAAEFFPEDLADHAGMAHVVALVGLASFKNPDMKVLELGRDGAGGLGMAKRWLGTLENETSFPRCRSWLERELDNAGKVAVAPGEAFDTIVIPGFDASTTFVHGDPGQLGSLCDANGAVVVMRKVPGAPQLLQSAGLGVIDAGRRVLLGVRSPSTAGLAERDAVIIVPAAEANTPRNNLGWALASHLKKQSPAAFRDIRVTTLEALVEQQGEESSSSGSQPPVHISCLEAEREMLATMDGQSMDRLQRLADVATDLIWLTGAGMLGSEPSPDLSLSSGLSRVLTLEKPSLRFAVLDVGPAPAAGPADLDRLVVNLLAALVPAHDRDDQEFIQKGGVLHISRFIAAREANALFRRRMQRDQPPARIPLGEVGPARLRIGRVGDLDSLQFEQDTGSTPTPPGFVDISNRAVSLNAKDVYTAAGRVETRTGTASVEFAGVVAAVGEGVTHLRPGDRAVVMAPSRFSTLERVPAWTAHRLLPGEDLTVMSTLPVAFVTALYALHDRARVRAGESVLVHSGAGAFGMAALMVARRMGAVVFATVGSRGRKEHLIRELGIPASHIFNSRDASFVRDIRAATGGRGVDVIINSLVGDLMHDSWDCVADFGRFVEVGKRELLDAGRLDMHVFARGCTFTAFDLSEMFYQKDQFYRDNWRSKMSEVLELYRAGAIKPAPITAFDVADIAKAYRFFSTPDRIGKVVISMQDAKSQVPVTPSFYRATLSPNKVYLLVGCLGGLGRSLSRWMMSRGAQNFVFMARSGADKPEAQDLVSRLRGSGASVTVVRGDVSSQTDVDAAVDACDALGLPIGGVVQAAMGLRESLFSRMAPEAWQHAVRPKWAGSWNLDRALHRGGRDAALDFFLMTSSVNGSVGSPTESNYCAANAFLDGFARWRRSQGRPAVSIGIGMVSEVGYLHENPEVEAKLLRTGMQPLSEAEFLQVVDLALAPSVYTSTPPVHILTGLETFSMRELVRRGFEVQNILTQDVRCGFLAAALSATHQDGASAPTGTTPSGSGPAPPWLRALPAGSNAAKSLAPEAAESSSLHDAVLRLARKRFANLILMPTEKIDENKALPTYGLDSMIASELRTWFWTAFKVDVPLLDIMSPKKSLAIFAGFVEEKLVSKTSGT